MKRTRRIKKRSLLILLSAAMVLVLLAGFGISRGVLEDKTPDGQKVEAAKEEQSGEVDQQDFTGTGNPEPHLGSDFIKTLQSGEYAIKYNVTTVYEGKAYEVETTYAVSGDSFAMISGDRATILKNKKAYMINHIEKTMISWNATESHNLVKIDTEGLAYQESGEANDRIWEAYGSETTKLKLYFDGEKLVRIDTKINGQDVVMDIVSVSKKVPESLFEVPSDYQVTTL